MTKVRQAATWRWLVRAKETSGLTFPHEMKRLDHCAILGAATVDTGRPEVNRRPWLVMFSRVNPPTVSMWNRRGWDVAPMRLRCPIGDIEVQWHARLGDAWYRVDFSTIQRPAG